jgi:SAM-dependent methyltransferase
MSRGWFTTTGRPGDRTLEDQQKGLEPLYTQLPGKSVVDIGCAEGLLVMDFVVAGAFGVHGIEIVPQHIEVARRLNPHGLLCTFEVADANDYVPRRKFDIVTMLAVLHKLRNPTAACARFADAARELCVIRLPPKHAPTIIDPRSGNNPHHIGQVMEKRGFRLEQVTRSHFDEWCGYYVRKDPL